MPNNWSNFINEILLNIDNDKPRNISPIESSDKKEITALNETDALILWKLFSLKQQNMLCSLSARMGSP